MDAGTDRSHYLLTYDAEEVKSGSPARHEGPGQRNWYRYLGTASFCSISRSQLHWPTPPPNVEFLVHNITALPKEWSGTFDLVHQSLLIAALRTEEWTRAINEAHRVLKSGGWAQFMELSLLWLQRGPVGRRLWDVFRAFSEARTMLSTCAEDIPQMLKDVGFCNVRNELVQIEMVGSTPDAIVARQSIIGAYRRLKKAIVQEGGFGIVGSGEEYDALLDELDREFETGVNGSYLMEFVAVVAQKA
ncbi:hypothetical protein K523DRAFT_412625 [Schizophyllum commune Tattone D]|nr:hypothetical protein K523DRAFT_412625 [Schizophyllum commune Tattone D]